MGENQIICGKILKNRLRLSMKKDIYRHIFLKHDRYGEVEMTAHSCMAIENTQNLLEEKSYTIKYVKIKDKPEKYKAPNMADFEIIINDNSAIILMPSKISHEHDSDLRYETLLDITLRQPKSIVNTTARIINVNPPKMLKNGNQCQIVTLDDSSYTMQFYLFGDYIYRYTIGDKLDIQGAKVMIYNTTYISMSSKNGHI